MAKSAIVLIIPMLLAANAAMAGINPIPELDPGSASMGVALLAGGLLVLKGRRRKR